MMSGVPLDATRNSLVLPILGLLVEQPAHAYDVAARLEARYPQLKTRRSSVVTLRSPSPTAVFSFRARRKASPAARGDHLPAHRCRDHTVPFARPRRAG